MTPLTMTLLTMTPLTMTLLTMAPLTMTLRTAKVGDGKAEELWKLSQKYAACKSRESPHPNPKPSLNAKP